MMNISIKLSALLLIWCSSSILRAEEISGFDVGQNRWDLNLGGEYPGAKAEFEIREDANFSHKGMAYAAITYDFSGGGAYVGIGSPTTALTEEAPVLSFWAKCSSRIRLKVRIIDSADQTFDLERLMDSDEWKKVEIDINTTEGFSVFGGSGDGQFQFPSKAVFIGFTKPSDLTGEVFLDTVSSSASADAN